MLTNDKGLLGGERAKHFAKGILENLAGVLAVLDSGR